MEETATPAPPQVIESAAVTTQLPQSSTPLFDGSNSVGIEDGSTPLKDSRTRSSSVNQLNSKNSWYGTWPRKSKPSTQVARESILADKPTNGSSSTELSRFEPRKSTSMADGRPPSMYLGKSKETSDISMSGTIETDAIDKVGRDNQTLSISENPKTESDKNVDKVDCKDCESPSQKEPDTVQRPMTSSGWLGGWLGRSTQPSNAKDGAQDNSPAPKTAEQPQQTPQQESSITAPNLDTSQQVTVPTASSSWFGLWSTAAPSTVDEAPKEQIPVKLAENNTDSAMQDASVSKSIAEPIVGSSWAFWSTDPTKKGAKPTDDSKETGQLAVAGDLSQSHPEPAKTTTVKDDKKSKPSKRGRPVSVEVDESSQKSSQLGPPSTKATPSQSPASAKTSPPNLLMPSVKSTYQLVENPSILQQIARLLLHGQQRPVKHVFLTKDPPKIKKALAIGIHGLFPAPLLRTVIGQPTGTSIRFANHAAAAIRRWGDQHGCVDCEIEKVALEGEGKIAERVDNLWKLLLNWIDHVRKADFIMIACHSQGVPVAVMLVAKLIEFGVVSTGKIGVCAMAGVSLGPFADYKSRLFSGSAGELFEFAEPESAVSKRYEDSLRVALKYGVRVTFCGSIDDQLVSMESSIFSTASHPYIYRAVFVDGRIHAPNFLSHLIGFALKLRNLGVSDHGLIRELSAPLAGSLYTGEGHSRLYDDEKVYDLAIEYTLETTSVGEVPLDIKKYEIPTNANPYVLPWIMRGLLEEDFVKTELDAEVTELLKQFDDWKPSTKVLKDVKYRLEAVRSRL